MFFFLPFMQEHLVTLRSLMTSVATARPRCLNMSARRPLLLSVSLLWVRVTVTCLVYRFYSRKSTYIFLCHHRNVGSVCGGTWLKLNLVGYIRVHVRQQFTLPFAVSKSTSLHDCMLLWILYLSQCFNICRLSSKALLWRYLSTAESAIVLCFWSDTK